MMQNLLKTVTFFVAAICLILFFTFTLNATTSSTYFSMGPSFSPWMEYQGTPSGFRFHVNLFTWSWVLLAVGVLSARYCWRLNRPPKNFPNERAAG